MVQDTRNIINLERKIMKQTLLNKLMNKAKFLRNVVLILVAIAAVLGMIYFFYWVGKTSSYVLFYEDMVQDTVREMVKTDSLKSP